MSRVISLHVIRCYDWNPMQSVSFSAADRPKTRCIKCVPKCASVRVAPSNIVYYCTDIDSQGKVN